MGVFRKRKKGFTVIEIVVVVAIIAVLATIVTVSTVAILKSSEKKSATSSLTNYWNLSVQAFNQINLGFTTLNRPNSSFLASRLGKAAGDVIVGQNECLVLSDGRIHIQYTDNPESTKNRYQIKRIVIKYKDHYYYTDDGKTIYGPRDSLVA